MDSKFFDQLGMAVVTTAKELSERAEELYEKQKIRGQILMEERALEKSFAALGKVVYANRLDDTSVEESLEDLCTEIKNHYEKIDILKESLDQKASEQKEPEQKEAEEKEPEEKEPELKEAEEKEAEEKEPEEKITEQNTEEVETEAETEIETEAVVTENVEDALNK